MKEKIILRSNAKNLEPLLRIGKQGLTENIIEEINKAIKKKSLIKIKLLKSSFNDKDKKQLIQELINKTNSELIESVGNIVVLYKK